MTIYLLTFLSLILISYLYIKIASHFNIVDRPNHRSSHIEPTIRGGGIIFFIAIALFFFTSNFEYKYFFLSVSIIAIISFIDDLISLGRLIRLFFHFATAILLLVQLNILGLPIWSIILLLVIIVSFFNLYNFLDGINGLTGIYSLVVLSGFLVLNSIEQLVNPSLIINVMLSILVFGFLNFRNKARWFAGDVGSMTLATLLFFLGGTFMLKLNAPILLIFVIVYAIDGGGTIFLRIIRRENITEAHRHHLYQKLVDVEKWSHLKVSIVYGLIQLFCNFIVYFTYKESINLQLVILCSVILITIVLYVTVNSRYQTIKMNK